MQATELFTSEECCVPYTCKRCGKPVEVEKGERPWRMMHLACEDKQRSEREAELLAEATIIPDYDGWVYLDGAGYNNGFFESIDDLVDYLADQDDQYPWPERVHTCIARPFPGIIVDHAIECSCDELFEGAYDRIVGREILEEANARFIEANKELVTYDVDFKHAVLVPRRAVT